MARLKVYRTPIGFHDAYVAAPSQKAALEAWGSDANLFARGIAEVVTDPQLMKEPLSRPGEVIKRTRGTIAQQIAALPKDAPQPRSRSKPTPPARQRPAQPRPDRSRVEDAEGRIADAEERHGQELRELSNREAELRKERDQLERQHATELARLERSAQQAREAYQQALDKWLEN